MDTIKSILAKNRNLTGEELTKVAIYIKEHEDDVEATNLFIKKCTPYVIKRVKMFNSAIEEEDLIQEGFIGVLEAIDRYDPQYEVAFPTYATYYIDCYIRKCIERAGYAIRLPSPVLTEIRKVFAVQKEKGEDVSVEDIAQLSGLTEKEVKKAMRAAEMNKITDIHSESKDFIENAAHNAKRFSGVPIKGTEETVIENLSKSEILDCLGKYLSEKEQYVLIMRYGLRGEEPTVAQKIGDHFNVTKERIYRIEKDALKKLRTHLSPEDFGM